MSKKRLIKLMGPRSICFHFGISIHNFDRLRTHGGFPKPDVFKEVGDSKTMRVPLWKASTVRAFFNTSTKLDNT